MNHSIGSNVAEGVTSWIAVGRDSGMKLDSRF
jgi:hypothetical protein